MQTSQPQVIVGTPVKRGKQTLIKIKCPWCQLEHRLAEGLRVPPCGSDREEYYVKGNN